MTTSNTNRIITRSRNTQRGNRSYGRGRSQGRGRYQRRQAAPQKSAMVEILEQTVPYWHDPELKHITKDEFEGMMTDDTNVSSYFLILGGEDGSTRYWITFADFECDTDVRATYTAEGDGQHCVMLGGSIAAEVFDALDQAYGDSEPEPRQRRNTRQQPSQSSSNAGNVPKTAEDVVKSKTPF